MGALLGKFLLEIDGCVLGKKMPSRKCDLFVLDGPGDQRFGTGLAGAANISRR